MTFLSLPIELKGDAIIIKNNVKMVNILFMIAPFFSVIYNKDFKYTTIIIPIAVFCNN